MAESDPKKMRPVGQPDRRSFDADEDPLVELARIVSEDSGFYGARSEKPKQQLRQVQPRREQPSDRSSVSADLEAELLQELESSFASRSSTPPSRSRSSFQPAPVPQPADDADDLLRSIEEQLGEFERRARSMQEQASEADAGASEPVWDEEADEDPRRSDRRNGHGAEEAWAAPAPPERTEEPRAPAPAPVTDWSSRQTAPAQSNDRSTAVRDDASYRRASEPRDAAERSASRRRDDATVQPHRAVVPPEAEELRRTSRSTAPTVWQDETVVGITNGTARQQAGWESTTDDDAEDVAMTLGNAAQPRSHESSAESMPDIEADFARGVAPTDPEPDYDSRWDDTLADASAYSREPQVAAAMIPPPRPRMATRERGPSRGLAAIAGVLGVVALGAAVAAYLRSGGDVSSQPPPVIAAEEGSVKVEAPAAPELAEGETVGDAVYERVAGDAPPAEEQVVESSEEPREVARIVLPPSQEAAADPLARPVGEADADASAAAGDAVLAGPRRVRTYIVRPDGTIVESESLAESPAPTEAQVAAVVPDGEPIAPVAVATTDINEAGVPATVAATSPAPLEPEIEAAAPDVAEPPAVTVAAEAPPASVVEAQPAPATAPDAETPSLAELTSETPAPVAEAPVEVAAAPPQEPAAIPAEPVAGGFLVQLSSQRTPEAAQSSFRDMQGRFPSILGSAQPVIQQADLGDQGIYYRVRVGPWASRSAAIDVCERLQSAGGDCFVTE